MLRESMFTLFLVSWKWTRLINNYQDMIESDSYKKHVVIGVFLSL